MLGSHLRAEPKPQPQHVGGESDVVMQDVKQDTKPLVSPKPQVSWSDWNAAYLAACVVLIPGFVLNPATPGEIL